MTVPGQLRCFIDRLGNSLPGPEQKHLKTVGVIAQGAHIFSGQEHAITDLINHALIMGCLPVSGDMWESYIGAGGWTGNSIRKDALKRLYAEGDLLAQATVRAAESIGKRVVQVALLLNAGGEAYQQMLSADGAYQAFLSHLS